MNQQISVATNRVGAHTLETTFDLLQATLPSIKSPETDVEETTNSLTPITTPNLKVPSPYVCSSEDEIYFGPPTDKEVNGKNARYVMTNVK